MKTTNKLVDTNFRMISLATWTGRWINCEKKSGTEEVSDVLKEETYVILLGVYDEY